MTRLFVENLEEETKKIKLNRKTSHYLRNVLRCSGGEEIVVFDGSGKEYLCHISDTRNEVILSVHYRRVSISKPSKDIILLQGLLKGQKMDMITQKAAEIGVKTIIPVITQRSQLRQTSKIPRWQKIASEASRQCGRTDVLSVQKPVNIHELISDMAHNYPDTLKIVFYENCEKGLKDLASKIKKAKAIVIFVGPEGGFPREEIRVLSNAGFLTAGLGKFTLRAETASFIASGIIQYISGQFN